MKKKLCLFLICLGFACSANSQTYSYRYSHSVNEDGVKKNQPWSKTSVHYITFVKNKSVCYESNEKGELLTLPFSGACLPQYKYIGKENDMYIYQDTSPNLLFTPNQQRQKIFTTDFMQYGYWTDDIDTFGKGKPWFNIFIYEPNPNKKEAPKNLF